MKLKKYQKFILISFIAFLFYISNLYFDYGNSVKTGTYRRMLTSYDVTSNTFLPYEIITKGKIYFSDSTVKAMRRVEGNNKPHSLTKIDDRYYSSYPILSGLMAVPLYYLPLVMNKIPTFLYQENLLNVLLLGRLSASLYTALSVGLFYLIIDKINKHRDIKESKFTYLYLLFYALGTNIYSISSRSLWQHTSSLLINTLLILLLIKAKDNPKIVKWLGLLCGLSFISRPTNILFILVITTFIFIKYKKEILLYFLTAGISVLCLALYYYFVYGSPITNEYIARGDTDFSTPLWDGLLGNMFSPSRSFLFITPPLALSFYGIYRLLIQKNKNYTDLLLSFLSISFIGTMLWLSTWWCWYGADRFGYGLYTEWIPIAGLIVYIMSLDFKKYQRIIFMILMIYSFYTQFNAVWFKKSRCSKEHNWTFECIKPAWNK